MLELLAFVIPCPRQFSFFFSFQSKYIDDTHFYLTMYWFNFICRCSSFFAGLLKVFFFFLNKTEFRLAKY